MKKSLLTRLFAGTIALAMLAFTTACQTSGDDSDDDQLSSLLALAAATCTPTTTANYRLTFDATWSAATHPESFPSNPHFSRMIGATHSVANAIWQSGGTATTGIENMAETGATTQLAAEIAVLQGLGQALTLIEDTDNIVNSPASNTVDFSTNNCNSLVSVVTMIAPSPDWFVGVNSLNLISGGSFVSSATHILYAYDAGTDSGTTYTAADSDTSPKGTITQINEIPFASGGSLRQMGTFTFTKL